MTRNTMTPNTVTPNTRKGVPISRWLLLVAVLAIGAMNWNISRADERTDYAGWVGTWEVTVEGKNKDRGKDQDKNQEKFTLTLEQSRRGLYGNYTPDNNQVAGRVYEGVLNLRCYQGNKLKSRAQLKLSADGKSFSGTAKREGEDKEFSWNGTRQ